MAIEGTTSSTTTPQNNTAAQNPDPQNLDQQSAQFDANLNQDPKQDNSGNNKSASGDVPEAIDATAIPDVSTVQIPDIDITSMGAPNAFAGGGVIEVPSLKGKPGGKIGVFYVDGVHGGAPTLFLSLPGSLSSTGEGVILSYNFDTGELEFGLGGAGVIGPGAISLWNVKGGGASGEVSGSGTLAILDSNLADPLAGAFINGLKTATDFVLKRIETGLFASGAIVPAVMVDFLRRGADSFFTMADKNVTWYIGGVWSAGVKSYDNGELSLNVGQNDLLVVQGQGPGGSGKDASDYDLVLGSDGLSSLGINTVVLPADDPSISEQDQELAQIMQQALIDGGMSEEDAKAEVNEIYSQYEGMDDATKSYLFSLDTMNKRRETKPEEVGIHSFQQGGMSSGDAFLAQDIFNRLTQPHGPGMMSHPVSDEQAWNMIWAAHINGGSQPGSGLTQGGKEGATNALKELRQNLSNAQVAGSASLPLTPQQAYEQQKEFIIKAELVAGFTANITSELAAKFGKGSDFITGITDVLDQLDLEELEKLNTALKGGAAVLDILDGIAEAWHDDIGDVLGFTLEGGGELLIPPGATQIEWNIDDSQLTFIVNGQVVSMDIGEAQINGLITDKDGEVVRTPNTGASVHKILRGFAMLGKLGLLGDDLQEAGEVGVAISDTVLSLDRIEDINKLIGLAGGDKALIAFYQKQLDIAILGAVGVGFTAVGIIFDNETAQAIGALGEQGAAFLAAVNEINAGYAAYEAAKVLPDAAARKAAMAQASRDIATGALNLANVGFAVLSQLAGDNKTLQDIAQWGSFLTNAALAVINGLSGNLLSAAVHGLMAFVGFLNIISGNNKANRPVMLIEGFDVNGDGVSSENVLYAHHKNDEIIYMFAADDPSLKVKSISYNVSSEVDVDGSMGDSLYSESVTITYESVIPGVMGEASITVPVSSQVSQFDYDNGEVGVPAAFQGGEVSRHSDGNGGTGYFDVNTTSYTLSGDQLTDSVLDQYVPTGSTGDYGISSPAPRVVFRNPDTEGVNYLMDVNGDGNLDRVQQYVDLSAMGGPNLDLQYKVKEVSYHAEKVEEETDDGDGGSDVTEYLKVDTTITYESITPGVEDVIVTVETKMAGPNIKVFTDTYGESGTLSGDQLTEEVLNNGYLVPARADPSTKGSVYEGQQFKYKVHLQDANGEVTGVMEGNDLGQLTKTGLMAPYSLAFVASHPDLIESVGSDPVAALAALEASQNPDIPEEERRGITFNSAEYLLANPDLLAHYGNDMAAAAKHYIDFGYQEGRQTSGVSVEALLENPQIQNNPREVLEALVVKIPGLAKLMGDPANATPEFVAQILASILKSYPQAAGLVVEVLSEPTEVLAPTRTKAELRTILINARDELQRYRDDHAAAATDPAHQHHAGIMAAEAEKATGQLATLDRLIANLDSMTPEQVQQAMNQDVDNLSFENNYSVDIMSNGFDEAYYLEHNPDVAGAVANGDWESGFEHYQKHGYLEGRKASEAPSPYFDEAYYLESNPDVAGAVANGDWVSGFEHFMKHGYNEGRKGTEKGSPLYNEAYYLENNPDVAGAVENGDWVSGFEHFKKHGFEEGRKGSAEALPYMSATMANLGNNLYDVSDKNSEGRLENLIYAKEVFTPEGVRDMMENREEIGAYSQQSLLSYEILQTNPTEVLQALIAKGIPGVADLAANLSEVTSESVAELIATVMNASPQSVDDIVNILESPNFVLAPSRVKEQVLGELRQSHGELLRYRDDHAAAATDPAHQHHAGIMAAEAEKATRELITLERVIAHVESMTPAELFQSINENPLDSNFGTYHLSEEDLGFDEAYYLENNPDVAGAVANGDWANGFEHFKKHGYKEGRKASANSLPLLGITMGSLGDNLYDVSDKNREGRLDTLIFTKGRFTLQSIYRLLVQSRAEPEAPVDEQPVSEEPIAA